MGSTRTCISAEDHFFHRLSDLLGVWPRCKMRDYDYNVEVRLPPQRGEPKVATVNIDIATMLPYSAIRTFPRFSSMRDKAKESSVIRNCTRTTRASDCRTPTTDQSRLMVYSKDSSELCSPKEDSASLTIVIIRVFSAAACFGAVEMTCKETACRA